MAKKKTDPLVPVGKKIKKARTQKKITFETLANEGINIRMISTSEIKISVVVDEKYLELAVRALHNEFGLDQSQ